MLSDEKIKKYIPELKKELGIKLYTPLRYFRGLNTKAQMKSRMKTMHERIKKAKKNPKAKNLLAPFKTDKKVKTKKSKWTLKFHKKYPGVGGDLKDIAKATKIPYRIIKKVYERGVKAFLTGHRPGVTAVQWGYGRVYSFIFNHKLKSLRHDKDLAKLIRR